MSFVSDFEGLPEPQGIDWNGGGISGMVRYSNDKQIFAVFYRASVDDPIASRQAGRRICKGVDHVRIQPPGERLTVIDRPATDNDKQRWPQQWHAYVQNQKQIPNGTPIDMLFPSYPEIGDTLRGLGVHTVEMCAALSGNAIENVGMGAQEYVNAAKRYLEHAQRGVQHHELETAMSEFKRENRMKDNQIKILTDEISHLKAILQQAASGLQPLPAGTIPPPAPAQPFSTMPMAGLPMPPAFPVYGAPSSIGAADAQTAMINATHSSADEAPKSRRGWPKGKARKPVLPSVEAPSIVPDGQNPPSDH